MSITMTICPEKLAEATQRSGSSVDLSEWQLGEIKAAINEADRCEFASNAEVKNLFDGWRRRGT